MWYYNSDSGTYRPASTVQSGLGYWVFASEAATIDHIGYPALDNTLELAAGWNLVGVSVTGALPDTPAVSADDVWQWTPDIGQYKRAVVFEAGKSYWIKAEEPLTITLE